VSAHGRGRQRRGIEETSVRALAKLEQVLPSRLRHRVQAMDAVTVQHRGPGPVVGQDLLTLIGAACRDRERLRFDYRDHSGAATRRTVEPYRIVHHGRRWYLLAYDIDRADWRTFRVDRIEPKPPTGPRFTPRELPDDAAAYVAKGVTSRAYRFEARVVLHARSSPSRSTPGPVSARSPRSTTTAANCGPDSSPRTPWRCPSACSAWTSRSASRPNSPSTCGSWPTVWSARRTAAPVP
jgi:predicted DNA-binding transcriptional regulator YafY